MHLRPARLLLAAAALALGGCYGRSFPQATGFSVPTAADCRQLPIQCASERTVHLFADANGTLYPNGWRDFPGLGLAVNRAGTLYRAATDPALRAHIDGQQVALLDEVRQRSQSAERVFILVHGFNNNVTDAAGAYGQLENSLNLTPRDMVVRFYWDGLTSNNPFGSGRIWFYAVGNSQLVGSRALRDVLRSLRGKQVYLIGHSRGASVILSALGNPVYDPGFRRETQLLADGWSVPDMLAPPALETNGNRFHVLLAAPAVDRIDFCDARHQPVSGGVDCDRTMMRPLPVESFRYTINPGDPVLDKYIGLSRRFNPTGFGLTYEAGTEMRAAYPVMRPYCLPTQTYHGFPRYIAQPGYQRMLRDAGLLRADWADGAVTGEPFECPRPA